ncbi:MAG: DEAD/DEAH box helicase [Fervidicoccaceae archaeon]
MRRGITKPTPIQERAIPLILSGRDVIMCSPTGTGKTEAAVLPVLSLMLQEGRPKAPRMIYVTPLRALNRDVYSRLKEISDEVGLRSMVRHGDSTARERRDFLASPPAWFITTPESLSMMISHERLRPLLSGIKWVIVDELHELIDDERGAQLEVTLLRLRNFTRGYQFIGATATLSDPMLYRKFYPCRRECVILEERQHKEAEYSVTTCGTPCLEGSKRYVEWAFEQMVETLKRHRSVLVFTNTREESELLGYEFRSRGESWLGVHHGSLSLDYRKNVEEGLRSGELRAVVATSSLELGIDVGTIDVVFHVRSPRQVSKLIQRVGRSGHAPGRTAHGVILAESNIDDIIESLVIARRARAGLLERPRVHKSPRDVLLHQLVGMTLSGEVKRVTDALEILERSFTFSETAREELSKVLEYAQHVGLLKMSGSGELFPTKRTRAFYFATTMIPDTRRLPVKSLSGENLGLLDEDFVAAKLEEGSTFLLAGREWRVVAVNNEEVIVEECAEKRGIPPSWEGDMIPVGREVAREACSILRRLWLGEPIDKVVAHYRGASGEVWDFLLTVTRRAKDQGFLPPGPNYVLIEVDERDEVAILYACLGSRGNDALAILLCSHINARLGRAAKCASDPYRVYVEVTRRSVSKVLEETLRALSSASPEELKNEFIEGVKKTGLFRWRTLQVARKMGAISPDATIENIRQVARYLTETVVGEEALRELLTEKLDLDLIIEILQGVGSGRIKVLMQPKRGLSPYTLYGGYGARRLHLQLEKPHDELSLVLFEKRLLEKKMLLKCIRCGWEREVVVRELEDRPTCRRCGSRALAPIHPSSTDLLDLLRRCMSSSEECNREDAKIFEEAVQRANLVLAHGRAAVIAMAAYGVGPRAASRALSKLKLGWRDFLEALFNEERNYLRTRKYWND